MKLAWAVTIHKAQGLTLSKLCVDIGKKEFSAGFTISRVRRLTDLLLNPPFTFQHLKNLSRSRRIQERKDEEKQLSVLELSTFPLVSSLSSACPYHQSDHQSTVHHLFTIALTIYHYIDIHSIASAINSTSNTGMYILKQLHYHVIYY